MRLGTSYLTSEGGANGDLLNGLAQNWPPTLCTSNSSLENLITRIMTGLVDFRVIMVELYMLLLRYCLGRRGVLMTSVWEACPNSNHGDKFCGKFLSFILLVGSHPILFLAVNEFVMIIREDVIEYEL